MRGRRERQPPPASGRRRRPWGRTGSTTTGERTSENDAAGEQERLIVEALSDLRERDVREVMTPRVDVVALTIPVHAEDVAKAVRESGHSCFPVVGDDLDDLVGVLFVNDLFRTGRALDSQTRSDPTPLDISRRLRTAYVLPESLGVLEALAAMRKAHRAFAVVVDEYGGTAGVLTVKDLLEPLVGDLRDEFDGGDEAPAVRVDHNRWLLDGRASVDEIRDRLGIDIPEGAYVTLGGFLFDGFGHIPAEGETLPVAGWDLKVVEMDKRRVAKVVARLHSPPSIAGDEGAGQARPDGREADTEAPAGGPAPRSDPRSGPEPSSADIAIRADVRGPGSSAAGPRAGVTGRSD